MAGHGCVSCEIVHLLLSRELRGRTLHLGVDMYNIWDMYVHYCFAVSFSFTSYMDDSTFTYIAYLDRRLYAFIY